MTRSGLERDARAVVARFLVVVAVVGAGACAADDSPPTAVAPGAAATVASQSAVHGCGKPLPADQPPTIPGTPKGYKQYTVLATGATLAGPQPQKAGPRTFWVRVPPDYDPSHAYRVVYLGQGCGGSGVANTSTYQLYKEASGGTEEAIYVAIDIPTDGANQDCYDNRDGPSSQEWEAFELFHSVVDANYCVDEDQIFVAGYSTGGWLANMWGCYFAGDGEHPWNGVPGGDAGASPRRFAPRVRLRGQAVVAGGEPSNNPPCNGPVAAIWISQAGANPTDEERAALARVLRMNGCEGSPTAPWHPEISGAGVCQQYTACPADYPVVFCQTNDCHADSHQRAIPAFTRFFDEATGRAGG
jgi:poly(3-hydroxybutyrate) depolymerase